MSQHKIEPEKITKPIQLVAAWFVALVLLVGSFLGAAGAIDRPSWVRGFLAVSPVGIIILFVVLIFLLQTRYRGQLLEDQLFREWDREKQEERLASATSKQAKELAAASEEQGVPLPPTPLGAAAAPAVATHIDVSEALRSTALSRAERLLPMTRGARVLWVDDHPENNHQERELLESLGMSVDIATTTEEGLQASEVRVHDLIISDMVRGGVHDEGERFVAALRERGIVTPVVFYVGAVDPTRGIPHYAFGITNLPDQLLHYVLDILDRTRGVSEVT